MGSPSSDPKSAERAAGDDRALALSRLCVIRRLPEPVMEEVDAALVRLLGAAITHVRASVAAQLAECDWAPLEAVRLLAFDDIEIARPLLERSRRLALEDLEALAALDRERRCALARRETVCERLSAGIARHRESECLQRLADNPGARLGDASAADFASVARGAPDLQRSLAARGDLSQGLARALMAVAGEAVKTELAARWPELSADRVEAAIEASVSTPADDAENAAAVDSLARQGLLNAADMTRAVRGGRQAMIDHVASRLTGLDVADWRRALSRSPLRAALLCARATALPPEEAVRLHEALANAGRAHSLAPDRLAAACEDVYGRYDRDMARRGLHRLGADASIG